MNKFARKAAEAVTDLLGAEVLDAEQPGGRRRESVRVRLADGAVIATRRPKTNRGRLEVGVLQALGSRTRHVPRIFAFEGGWLIQEDLGERRLSEALAHANAKGTEAWLDAALLSLHDIHEAGRAAGLEAKVAVIGQKTGWLEELITMPGRLGAHLDMPPPAFAEESLLALLRVSAPRFIKWDARPGNAVAREDGTVAWFDWEHCGARAWLDDAAWLLCDEYADGTKAAEGRLLARHLDAFADGRGADEAAAYLAAFGTFHMCVRLGLILKYKERGEWWDAAYCLERDKIGVTRAQALLTARRAARWAGRAAPVRSLAPWFVSVAARIEEM